MPGEKEERKKKAWFDTGYDGIDDLKKERDDDAQKGFTRRFRIPMGASAKLVFLDGEPFRFYEHCLNLNGWWNDFFTCIQRATGQECPVCATDSKPYYVGMYTVIRIDEWEDKKGNTYKNQKMLYPAKLDTLQMLRLKSEQYGLKGCAFTVNRVGSDRKRTPAVGNDFNFIKKIDMKKLAEDVEDINPFDYEELFKPKSAEELKRILNQAHGQANEESGNDDEIPY